MVLTKPYTPVWTSMTRKIQPARPVEFKGQINPGDVVVFKPSHWCPSIWRPLAEHLEGKTFQIIGTARLIYWDALVLQPWPCMEVFPGYQLADAESLQLADLSPAELAQVPRLSAAQAWSKPWPLLLAGEVAK